MVMLAGLRHPSCPDKASGCDKPDPAYVDVAIRRQLGKNSYLSEFEEERGALVRRRDTREVCRR